MPSRSNTFRTLCRLLDDIESTDAGNGWPGRMRLRLPSGGLAELAIYVGPVGPSGRNRDEVERRFQNPGSNRPIRPVPNARTMLVGVWEGAENPVLAVMEASRRVGRGTRQSFFLPLEMLQSASMLGFAEAENTTGEFLVALRPELFSAFVESREKQVDLPAATVKLLARTAGLFDGIPGAKERVRMETSALLRDRRFRKLVLAAYGHRCCVCDLGLGILEAAHILPVGASGSTDDIENGMCLCANHHRVFDRHRMWIEPETLRLVLHPSIASTDSPTPTEQAFVKGTRRAVRRPGSGGLSTDMLEARYAHFEGLYTWADGR